MTLNELIAQVLRDKPANITDGTSRATHRRWDSFAHVEIVVQLEEAYAVKFTNSEIETMTSVPEIRTALASKGVAV
ncbi:MAG: acyl carrier protein [Myxococcales bacterium]|nr:acyl carrier protein [Myxococcales bacterium]